jgi:diaminohydroxyphosphoribosylaminopyrimidine deaminase/5-amino-6-(5-phosphoribosylamino)uracil reductase
MVGAVLVNRGKIIGQGWHRRAGGPHAEIEALNDAKQKGHSPGGATLYVTLEPCSTRGRTPPCSDAIIAAGIRRVVVGATDPNPSHRGRAFRILRRAGIEVVHGVLADEATRLNEAFNYWIVNRTPFVTVKAAMTLDGKIATAGGESKWITGVEARDFGMKLRQGADAILVGINTVLADNPSLIFRALTPERGTRNNTKPLRRIILDANARTPLTAKVVTDEHASLTTIMVTEYAPRNRVAALAKRAKVVVASPARSQIANRKSKIDLGWLLKRLGAENVTNLLVEGGGEVNASFLLGGLAQRVAFFYGPKVLCGRNARKAVAGDGVTRLEEIVHLRDIEWRQFGPDLLLTARVDAP